jgi:hypothetical protein
MWFRVNARVLYKLVQAVPEHTRNLPITSYLPKIIWAVSFACLRIERTLRPPHDLTNTTLSNKNSSFAFSSEMRLLVAHNLSFLLTLFNLSAALYTAVPRSVPYLLAAVTFSSRLDGHKQSLS